jgi:Ser/Thr protein kinase RdoA (MazF antagonist)
MFRILELDGARSSAPRQVGEAFATWDDALAAIKRHLKGFKVSGRNPEGSYWWTRDADGLRKCWIAENKDGALAAVGAAAAVGAQGGPAHDPSK